MKNTQIIHLGLLFAILLFLTHPLKAAQVKSYTNSIGMKFVNIPAGSFYMGSCKQTDKQKFMNINPACPSGGSGDNNAEDNETPQHKVRISKSFQMGIHEVTLGQFKKFIAGANRDDLLSNDFMEYNSHGNSAAVSYVSWHDAQSFIKWLNKKEGGNRYRLPTEAEWEYAARAGTTTVYSWGNSAGQAGKYAWYDKHGGKYAHSVGRKKPNPWGLYDMHGNVWEWCQDWYVKNYYRDSPLTDPKGPSSDQARVRRGGGWYHNVRLLRSSLRDFRSPGYGVDDLGFRLVRQP